MLTYHRLTTVDQKIFIMNKKVKHWMIYEKNVLTLLHVEIFTVVILLYVKHMLHFSVESVDTIKMPF